MSEKVEMNWGIVKSFWPQVKTIVNIVLLVFFLDIIFSIGASFFLSDAFYFKKYIQFRLYEGTQSYAEITQQYFDEDYKLHADKAAGWVNSANYEKKGLLWGTDYLGARSPVDLPKVNMPPEGLNNRDNLVLLAGSSVLSGYRLPYEQAPVNLLNEQGYTAFSYGTIMYSIDQTYAFYKEVLAKYKPKVLVVGIHNDAEVISNMFVPFRLHDMSVPFLKPAYTLADGELVKKEPPVAYQREKDYGKMLDVLKAKDSLYYKFALYKYFSLTPFSDLFRKKLMAAEQYFFDEESYRKAFKLQHYFMQKIVNSANDDGTQVIFVKFEPHEDLEWLRHLPLHNQKKNKLHNQMLKETDMNVIYLSEVFVDSGNSLSDLYQGYDTVHLSATGCDLLAKAIHKEIQMLGD